MAREVLADAGLPPATAAQPVSAAHTEISVVAERRRTLIRRRQRLLNEAEAVLSKLPLDLRAQLGTGTVGARLRRLARLDADGELVEWLKEMLEDLLEWERRVAELESACRTCSPCADGHSRRRSASAWSQPRSLLPRSVTQAASAPRVFSLDGRACTGRHVLRRGRR